MNRLIIINATDAFIHQYNCCVWIYCDLWSKTQRGWIVLKLKKKVKPLFLFLHSDTIKNDTARIIYSDRDSPSLLFKACPCLKNHSPSPSSEVKNVWSITPILHTSSWRGAYLSTRKSLPCLFAAMGQQGCKSYKHQIHHFKLWILPDRLAIKYLWTSIIVYTVL
jgi:hypothetical protein